MERKQTIRKEKYGKKYDKIKSEWKKSRFDKPKKGINPVLLKLFLQYN